MVKNLGTHLLMDFYGCDREIIDSTEDVRRHLMRAARNANATIVQDVFHTFSPQGVSGVVVIAESHIAIHTWPEFGCASVDVFSCSDKIHPEIVRAYLTECFRAKESTMTEMKRGTLLPRHLEPEKTECANSNLELESL